MIFLILISVSLVSAQNNNVDIAILDIFGNQTNNFLNNTTEVTQPPLKDYGALQRCGDGEQKNSFVCVPYYNCDPATKTVVANPEADGSNAISIRLGDDDRKCDHFLEVCCKISNETNADVIATTTPLTPRQDVTQPTPSSTTTPRSDTVTPSNQSRAFCGIRNENGLDFNLIASNNEAQFGEFPWMVAVLRRNPADNQNLALCGGSLITPRVVLTGAHCVSDIDASGIKIRAGEWDSQTQNERIPFQERNVVTKIVHEYFINRNLYYDVALLILDRPLTKTQSVGTVCLPQQKESLTSRNCFATGWGKDNFGKKGKYAVILKKIQLPMVQHDSCQQALRRTRLGNKFVLHHSFICAGGERGVDTCTGDGGGPLVCPDPKNPGRYLQAGIVAWGIGCGEDQVPGVYVDVAQFREWIDSELQKLQISSDPYIY